MRTQFLGLILILSTLSFYGQENTNAVVEPTESNYYGAELTKFPPDIREWVMEAFSKESMENEFMIDSKLKVWWNDDDNSVSAEASYTIAEGYVGAGTVKVWGTGALYSGSPNIWNIYGKYAKYHTLRFEWELKQKIEQLLRKDPAYAQLIAFAKQLCDEIEYDWTNFSAYQGSVKRTPNKKYYVCEGYAEEVMNRALGLSYVQAVQKWTSSNHAWNVIKLTDGRTLYFDVTWFDNEHINEETGEIYETDDYDWKNITFDSELFKYSNVGYGSRVFSHEMGELKKEVVKE